jgi:hypothetical protein
MKSAGMVQGRIKLSETTLYREIETYRAHPQYILYFVAVSQKYKQRVGKMFQKWIIFNMYELEFLNNLRGLGTE